VRWVFVIARQSSFIYKIRSADVKQIGRELGVRYLVEGSVRKSGTRVRIVAQLIETETGAHIWADRYEGDLRDIFALQDEITQRIVSAIEPTVRTVEFKRALAKPTGGLTAYDSYLRALPYYYSQTREAVLRAETLLQEAIDLDPGFAEALGTLADCNAIRTSTGWHESRGRGTDEACEAARRALAAGPDNSTCVASAAFAYGSLGHRFDEALELAERAIQVHPNSTFVRNRAGAIYSVSGESDKAIAQFEAAQRMNPLDNKTATVTFTVATTAHFFARRFEERSAGEGAQWQSHRTQISPLDCCRGSRASWASPRGASRDRQDSRAASHRYARTRTPRKLPLRLDVRSVSRRAAKGRIARAVSGVERGQSVNATGLSGLRLTDNEKMSGRA
jgi:adenylate cyclase